MANSEKLRSMNSMAAIAAAQQDAAITALGQKAANAAMQAAAAYLKPQVAAKLIVADAAFYTLLVDTLRAEINAAMDEAIVDAKKALECNMGAVAEWTFTASMTAAGIKAAKAVAEALKGGN